MAALLVPGTGAITLIDQHENDFGWPVLMRHGEQVGRARGCVLATPVDGDAGRRAGGGNTERRAGDDHRGPRRRTIGARDQRTVRTWPAIYQMLPPWQAVASSDEDPLPDRFQLKEPGGWQGV